MTENSNMVIRRILLLFLLTGLLALLPACRNTTEPYHETFDAPGNWSTDNDAEVRGEVINGVYEFEIKADTLTTWTTAGQNFSDGWYEVEATQTDGPDNNLYGMLFRVNNETEDFYAFQISGDGYVWIGRYKNGGKTEATPIIGNWWFESAAIKQGAGITNRLKVRAEAGNLIFYVNDQEVGRITDNSFAKGDIGLIAGSLGQNGVVVQFDNFKVSPLEE
ncbi:MAG TPA: hypothetical protein PLD25_13890 [Chloroflexota bacterium]|nr:hypothetical protein [Chloroflexota bacterium]HUM69729.1 hypothetical protein [Chloroflexota bacterium]